MQDLIIKFIDIVFITTVYILPAILSGFVFKKFETQDEDQDKKSLFQLILEIIIFFSITNFIIYCIEIGVSNLAFPLNGKCGYDHKIFCTHFIYPASAVIVMTLIIENTFILQKIRSMYKKIYKLS